MFCKTHDTTLGEAAAVSPGPLSPFSLTILSDASYPKLTLSRVILIKLPGQVHQRLTGLWSMNDLRDAGV